MVSFKKDFSSFSKLDNARKSAVLFMLLTLLILGFVIGTLISKNLHQTSQSEARVNPNNMPFASNPNASLSLSPSSVTLGTNETSTISVNLTGGNVQAADIVLTYDPEVFSVSTIEKGPAFSTFIPETVSNGRIEVSALNDPTGQPGPAQGKVFTFVIRGLKPTVASAINFDLTPNTGTILAKDGVNVLKSANGGTYTVSQ